MKSNCFIEAWKIYRGASPGSVWLHFRKSQYSKWLGIIPRPVKLIAELCLWPTFGAYLFFHMLAFGTFPHFGFSRTRPKMIEFLPIEPKTDRWFPPIIYHGELKGDGIE